MVEAVRTSETSVDNHFTRQYIPEANSEHHTRRRENLKSHKLIFIHTRRNGMPFTKHKRSLLFQFHFNIILPYTHRSHKWYFPFRLSAFDQRALRNEDLRNNQCGYQNCVTIQNFEFSSSYQKQERMKIRNTNSLYSGWSQRPDHFCAQLYLWHEQWLSSDGLRRRFSSRSVLLSAQSLLSAYCKVKSKSSPVTRHGGAWGERRYSSYSLTTSALMGMSGQRHAPAALYPLRKDPRYPLYRRLGGPQSRSGHIG
jgi:hypothetical protein